MNKIIDNKKINPKEDFFKGTSNLSIIIPSFCSQYLERVVESARYFKPLEIIVVDSSPSKPIIKNVTLYHQKKRLNAAEARNKGANLAHGDLLLFIDSDVVLNKNIETIKNEYLSEKDNRVICGLYEKNPNENKISSFQRGVIEKRLSYKENKKQEIYSSSHFLIRRNKFFHTGGFNETFSLYEDIEFFLRCKKFGLEVILDKSFMSLKLLDKLRIENFLL